MLTRELEIQFLLQTRLERISDGCMEFINPQLIECLVCNMTYMLHRPFNMCRAIRHLRSKHPDLMPEFSSTADAVSLKIIIWIIFDVAL